MKFLIATAALAILTAGPVHADCPYPAPPDKIPDGNTASLDEMVTVEKAVAKGGDKLSDKQKADLDHMETQRHNAAVAQLQSIADRFNEQVRIYKAKNAKKDGS